MTEERLQEILSLPTLEERIGALKVSDFTIPEWSKLEEQYDPLKHSIFSTSKYPPRIDDETGQDDFKRTPKALQKLAVNRMSQAIFDTPISRRYNYDKENERQQQAVDILEELYRVENFIDSENLERCKLLNMSCQIATVWTVYEKENVVQGEKTKYKLTHTTYAEPDGYKIYANTDANKNLLVVSIGYTDASNQEHFEVYINGKNPQYLSYTKKEEWVMDEESKALTIFPVVYTHLKEPVWGGEAGTKLVEQLEEMESFDGMYIKKNAAPTFTQDMGDLKGLEPKEKKAVTSTLFRKIIRVGKGGSMKDVTWTGAGESLEKRMQRIENDFFEMNQVPNNSFQEMLSSNTSAENKEIVLADVKAKAKDLGGEWEKLSAKEWDIVLEFAKILFPAYKNEFETISVRSTVNPYSVRSKKENAEYVATAGEAMSLETKVRVLDEVDDVGQEVERIQEEQAALNNQI